MFSSRLSLYGPRSRIADPAFLPTLMLKISITVRYDLAPQLKVQVAILAAMLTILAPLCDTLGAILQIMLLRLSFVFCANPLTQRCNRLSELRSLKIGS